ncbi:hypothetical protein AHF37_01293 [Paragonimus kellicotti]|nr:hypothetical protein AHF37_01293 [Paragonimus kellicotti]
MLSILVCGSKRLAVSNFNWLSKIEWDGQEFYRDVPLVESNLSFGNRVAMVPLISKVFCLTNSDDVRDAIQMFSKSLTCDVIPNLKPDMLMEDEFVAGFCTKGEVTIIPLLPSPDFDFSMDKSILTFRMSPTVYSGFGLACTKVKEKFKKFHYREFTIYITFDGGFNPSTCSHILRCLPDFCNLTKVYC